MNNLPPLFHYEKFGFWKQKFIFLQLSFFDQLQHLYLEKRASRNGNDWCTSTGWQNPYEQLPLGTWEFYQMELIDFVSIPQLLSYLAKYNAKCTLLSLHFFWYCLCFFKIVGRKTFFFLKCPMIFCHVPQSKRKMYIYTHTLPGGGSTKPRTLTNYSHARVWVTFWAFFIGWGPLLLGVTCSMIDLADIGMSCLC